MKRLIQVREKTYNMVHDVLFMPKELNKIELEKKLEGYEVSRAGFGIVVVSLPDGEIHYVPAGDRISEIIFKYGDEKGE